MSGSACGTSRPKVLIVAGYFDWFSGYQETAIARAMTDLADTSVLAGDRVSPIFSDDHLARIQQSRRYDTGTRVENRVTVTRVPTRELRSMVWASGIPRMVSAGDYDLVIQVMPGQLLPSLASLSRGAQRVVLYGDNKAMYSSLSPALAACKFAVFCITKGALYTCVNLRANRVYGYTPDTIRRLRAFHPNTPMSLFPLSYDESAFHYSRHVRTAQRAELGISDDSVVILAAGKVNPQKRIDLLVRAFDEVRNKTPQVRLLLAGLDDGESSRSLRELIKKLGIQHLVKLFPFVDAHTLNRLFNAADIGIWPRMPAVTIQQAMGTGLDVLIPQNEFTSHLFGTGQSVHQIGTEGKDVELQDIVAAVTLLSQGLPQCTDERRRATEENARYSSASLCRDLLREIHR